MPFLVYMLRMVYYLAPQLEIMPASSTLATLIIFSAIETSFEFSQVHRLPNLLNGKHLRVIWTRWEGNAYGLGGPLKSGVIIDYLSARFNFTYSMVKVSETALESSEKKKGLFSYLLDNNSLEQRCDLLLQDVVPSSRRMEIVDMTTAVHYTYTIFLIPVSDYTADTSAIIKPFQWPVWLLIIVCIICAIFTLKQLELFGKKFSYSKRSVLRKKYGNNLVASRIRKDNTDTIYLYVFGNLLSQGGPCISKRLSFRIVAGVWTLGAFVIVQAYSSILFTYIMTPISLPFMNSISDVFDKSDIHLFIRKGGSLDKEFSNTSELELYRKFGKKLDSLPNSRCTHASACINLITPGTRNVFLESIYYQMDAIKENFDKTGKCNLQLATATGYTSGVILSTFALPKQSPYTRTLSQGILELRESGLINHWDTWFRPMPAQCSNNLKPSYKGPKGVSHKVAPLSLKHLFGAFLMLCAGISLSILALLYEKIIFSRLEYSV